MPSASVVAVRSATLDDVQDIRSLLIQTWHDTFDPIHGVEAVDKICETWGSDTHLISRIDKKNACCIVAFDGVQMQGMAFANGPNEENIAYLSQLYVLKSAQGGGVGKRLLNEIESAFKHANIIRLGVDALNINAIAFYESVGYRNIGIVFERDVDGHKFQNMIFEKPLSDPSSSGH